MNQVHISFVLEDGTHILSIVCDHFLPHVQGETVYSFPDATYVGILNTIFIDERGGASQMITVQSEAEAGFWK